MKYLRQSSNGKWTHRPPFKVILNPILRFLQFWTDRPYVIATMATRTKHNFIFKGYKLSRVRYDKKEYMKRIFK